MTDDISPSSSPPASTPDISDDESTALLPKPYLGDAKHEPPQYRQWLSEIWFLTKASIPVILAYTLQNSLQTISVLIVGRLSPEALATAAFCYSKQFLLRFTTTAEQTLLCLILLKKGRLRIVRKDLSNSH